MSGSDIFNYLSDDPQVYILLLKDYIRPNPDICTPCKTRCLESFIKTASASGLAWNRLSPDGRPRPPHTRLDAQLSALGITASNAFGLSLPDSSLDAIFQPAVRRLMIDREWDEIVSDFVAMTAYRGLARPDRYAATNCGGHDRYALGKKMEHMLWPRFTAHDLVRPRGGQIESWLFNLGQLLSDGAGVFLSAADEETDCTCPIFTALSSRHPNTFTGYEWINLVLSAARERVDPALLSAWSHPLFTEDLSIPFPHYRPLCPGYDCRLDTRWQTPISRFRRYISYFDGPMLADISDVNQRDIELSFLFGFDIPTGTNPLDSPERFPAENRETFINQFTDWMSAPGWFYFPRLTLVGYPKDRLAHHMRGSMVTAFIALSGLKLNRSMENGHGGVDWVTASAFHFSPSPDDPIAHPMKKVFEQAVRDLRQNAREVMSVSVDENKAEGVRPFVMPRNGSRRGRWGAFESWRDEEGRGEEMRKLRNGMREWADQEDSCLDWEPEEHMRTVFELE